MNILDYLKTKLMLSENKVKNMNDTEIGISLMDKCINAETHDEQLKAINELTTVCIKPNGPMIYAFITPKVKNAIKVGFTDQAVEKRIDQWREIYDKDAIHDEDKIKCIGFWTADEFDNVGQHVFFWDHAVHNRLKRNYEQLDTEDKFKNYLAQQGCEVNVHVSREFFVKYAKKSNKELSELSEQIISDIISEMKNDIKSGKADFILYKYDGRKNEKADTIWPALQQYTNTDLQEEAIKNGVKAINEGKTNLLLAAVMRFGKTHATYEIIKQANQKLVLITSAKADVRKAWRDDINHKDFANDFVFIEIKDKYGADVSEYDVKNKRFLTTYGCKLYSDLDQQGEDIITRYKKTGKTVILFLTLQDLTGSNDEIKKKHTLLNNHTFDLLVVDETHYGSHAKESGKVTHLGQNEYEDDVESIQDAKNELEEAKQLKQKLNVKAKCTLQMSGTPYYILKSNEMLDDNAEIISKVSYTDMIEAKEKWEREHTFEDPHKNPYFGVPTLHKIGLHLSKECKEILKNADIDTSMSTLLKIKGNKFVHEEAIKHLMQGVFGNDSHDKLGFLENKELDGTGACKHTMMVLPRIETCHVMKKLLLNGVIDTNKREVIVLVSDELCKADVSTIEELNNKLEELDNSGKKSLVLTVKRFLTGVSMPFLDSMLYMKNAQSPQDYDQSIFRLCTRLVRKATGDDGDKKEIQVKRNVYLIDFNVANMFKMVANSARMKAIADGDTSAEHVKRLINQDLNAVPIFGEDTSDGTLGKMHQLTTDDLMRIYTGYNKNKSINDIVYDEIDLFGMLFETSSFQNTMDKINITGDNGKAYGPTINNDGEDEINVSKNDAKADDEDIKHLREFAKNKIEKKNAKLTKEKFIAFVKTILYCNICFEEQANDIPEFIHKVKNIQECKDIVRDYELQVTDIQFVYNALTQGEKSHLNDLLMKISMLMNDSKISQTDRFMRGIADLGRIGKSEVITPNELVEKMVKKIPANEFERSKSILLVNEKCCEFLTYINRNFGKDVANKCRIVPSSKKTVYFLRKIVKSLGLNDYIILDIEDTNGNGQFEIEDFLNLDNDKFLKDYNMSKKFDICLMNPPYGNRKIGDEFLHQKFVEKCNEISFINIVVMPFKTIYDTSKDKKREYYKEIFDKKLISVNQEDSSQFVDTKMPDVAIYVFSVKRNAEIEITDIKGNKTKIDSLKNLSYNINEKDSSILNYLRIDLKDVNAHLCQVAKDEKRFESWCSALSKYEKKIYLTTNSANGGMNARFFSTTTGNIFNNIEDLKKNFYKRNGAVCNIMLFNSFVEAENCKCAMQNPLLRFALYKVQDNQNIRRKCYQYIPNVDWSNPKVKTDEGLLELCGCPKDKAKEYAQYCKDIIEKVDKGERP